MGTSVMFGIKLRWRAAIHLLLAILGVLFFFPFYWMFVQSTHTSLEILRTPPPVFFGGSLAANYRAMMDVIPFWRNFANSLFVSAATTTLSLLFCSMGGYAFAMYSFPGKKALFNILLLTMMLPWIVSLIPWFIIMSRLGWVDRLAALIVPGAANAFGIFWMRQYIGSHVPKDLLHSARIDGCPEGLIFFRIFLPLLTPALGALGILNFLNSWNNFFFPMVVLQTKGKFTIPLALRYLNADPYKGMDFGVTMLGASMAVIPILVVFWAASRQFISGLTAGALKE